jgi:hypothetical protein
MKFTKLMNKKPRNPFVALCILRQAGSHRAGRKADRQRSTRELRAEMNQLHPPPTPAA